MMDKFGYVVAKMGFGPFAGQKMEAEIGFVPQETRVYLQEDVLEDGAASKLPTPWETVSELEIDILKRMVTVTERLVCDTADYDEWSRRGMNVKLLGATLAGGAEGQKGIKVVVERITVGELLEAEFRSDTLQIRYVPNDPKPVSFVIFNYEPVINLSHLSITASALKRGTGWLTVNIGVYPLAQLE